MDMDSTSLGIGSGHTYQQVCFMQGRCSLKDQILHKAAFMKEHMLLPGRPPAFVLGHSIGKTTLLPLLSLLHLQALHLLQEGRCHRHHRRCMRVGVVLTRANKAVHACRRIHGTACSPAH